MLSIVQAQVGLLARKKWSAATGRHTANIVALLAEHLYSYYPALSAAVYLTAATGPRCETKRLFSVCGCGQGFLLFLSPSKSLADESASLVFLGYRAVRVLLDENNAVHQE